MTIGKRLKQIRKNVGATLHESGVRSGLALTFICDVENDKVNLSLKSLQKLAKGYQIPLTDLVRGVGEDDKPRLDDIAGLEDFLKGVGVILDDDWIGLLSSIQIRGKRPINQEEYLELFMYLKRLLFNGVGSVGVNGDDNPKCKQCHQNPTFTHRHKYCSDKCSQIAKREQARDWYRKQDSFQGRIPGAKLPCTDCGQEIVVRSIAHKYCAGCGATRNLRSRRKYEMGQKACNS